MYDAIQMHRKVDGRDWICVSPVNLYGKYDNFNLETGHAIACLIYKFMTARFIWARGVVQGDGTPLRQCLYTDDFVAILIILINKLIQDPISLHDMYNIAGDEYTIKQIAETIALQTNVERIYFRGDELGCPRKTVADDRIRSLLPNDFKYTSFEVGVGCIVQYLASKKLINGSS
jgi:GDP-L-fucose synthase